MEQKSHPIPIIIGDIGGTNIRLQIITLDSTTQQLKSVKHDILKTVDYKSLKEALVHFLKEFETNKENYPTRANIGIAGPVFNNKVKISNVAHWEVVDGDAISKELNIPNFKLFNDFEIASYAVLGLHPEEQIQINNAEHVPNQIISVCGAGTGFGVSMLVPSIPENSSTPVKYTVWPGEGGHSAFSPVNSLQAEYYEYVKTNFFPGQPQVALEYCFVGPAIPHIYYFLSKKNPDLERVLEKELGAEHFDPTQKNHFPSEQVFEYGASGKDLLSRLVVDFFWDLFTTVLGDISIRTLSYSGVYLIGNITKTICDYVVSKKDHFLKDYKESRKYLSATFDKLPVYIVRKELGLDGAIAVSRQQLGL